MQVSSKPGAGHPRHVLVGEMGGRLNSGQVFDEETDYPLIADQRNFYKVEAGFCYFGPVPPVMVHRP